MSPVLHPTLPSESNGQTKPARKSLLQDAQRLKELKVRLAERPGPSAEVVDGLRTRFEEELGPSPILRAELDAPHDSPLQKLLRDKSIDKSFVAKVYTTVERQDRQSNKENIDTTSKPKAFIEPQNGAKKVDWNDEFGEDSGENSRNTAPRVKRRRGCTEGDYDEEDDFEETASAAADKRRRELRDKTGRSGASQRPSSRHPRSEVLQSVHSDGGSNDDVDDDSRGEQRARDRQPGTSPTNSSSVRTSRRSPSSHPARNLPRSGQNTHISPTFSAPVSTGEHLERVREQARQRVVTIKPRRVQSRSSYNEYEEERLINLIEEYGISYCLIKQMDEHHEDGPLLGERNQVQLKDKAQELKFQFLK
jgi:hypothetical protein